MKNISLTALVIFNILFVMTLSLVLFLGKLLETNAGKCSSFEELAPYIANIAGLVFVSLILSVLFVAFFTYTVIRFQAYFIKSRNKVPL